METEQSICLQPKEFKDYGVIVDGGSKVYMKGFTHYEVDKITDEQFEDIANDYDDIEAPPGPYKVQPENQGVYTVYDTKIIYIEQALAPIQAVS